MSNLWLTLLTKLRAPWCKRRSMSIDNLRDLTLPSAGVHTWHSHFHGDIPCSTLGITCSCCVSRAKTVQRAPAITNRCASPPGCSEENARSR